MDYTVDIERMAYGPDGIGHLPNGKTVFVEGVVPGDTVNIRVTDDQPKFARAKLLDIVNPSPDRVAPFSAIDEVCGTAPWQCLSYDAQLQAKEQNVVGALVHGAHVSADHAREVVMPIVACEQPWYYRNKLELGCGHDANGRFIAGFYREHTDELISAPESALAHKAIANIPKALQGAIRYAEGSRDLHIYRVGVRQSENTGDLEVALWTPPSSFPRATFAKALRDATKATGVIRVMAEPGSARKIKGVEVLEGNSHWHEKLAGFDFFTQAPSFFQVNTKQAEKLIELVLEELGDIEGAYVADLFAGGGTFTIPIAASGADVVAVESVGSSVRDLRANAERNHVEIDVIGGDATRELQELDELDALVVDPPRSGLGAQTVDAIAQVKPHTVVYVSCDPATWARDVALLEKAGYELVRATPVDMFPQTYHCEIVSSFRISVGRL